MSLMYPPDFVRRIKSEYLCHRAICSAVETGSYVLGKHLAEEASKRMTLEDIVGGSKTVVSQNARAIVRRKALHVDWIKIMVRKISSLDDELKK